MDAAGVHRTLLSYVQGPRKSRSSDVSDRVEAGLSLPSKNATRKISYVPNPVKCLRLLWAKDCILVVLIFGIFYMNLNCVQASTSSLFIDLYGVSELSAGLVYLPSGIGSIIGAYGAGEDAVIFVLFHLARPSSFPKLSFLLGDSTLQMLNQVLRTGYVLKHDYLVTARKHGIEINAKDGDDLTKFPIEEARLRSIAYSISSAGVSTIGYGWALHTKVVSRNGRHV